jgi:hypothetical protein
VGAAAAYGGGGAAVGSSPDPFFGM